MLHLGSMDLKDYTGKLGELLERGAKDTPKFQKFVAEAIAKRDARKEKAFARGSRKHLSCYCRRGKTRPQTRPAKIARASRSCRRKMISNFLHEFSGPEIVYWHDTGHAQIKENFGLIRHAEHLASLADRLAGFHIHDVQFPTLDHCAPGTGMIDYAALKLFVKPEHVKVFEFSNKVPVEAAKAGIAHVKKIWGAE